MHDRVCLSGKYNFEGCRFPLNTNLNIDYFTPRAGPGVELARRPPLAKSVRI